MHYELWQIALESAEVGKFFGAEGEYSPVLFVTYYPWIGGVHGDFWGNNGKSICGFMIQRVNKKPQGYNIHMTTYYGNDARQGHYKKIGFARTQEELYVKMEMALIDAERWLVKVHAPAYGRAL